MISDLSWQETKLKKDMLEAAFDGEDADLKKLMAEAEDIMDNVVSPGLLWSLASRQRLLRPTCPLDALVAPSSGLSFRGTALCMSLVS